MQIPRLQNRRYPGSKTVGTQAPKPQVPRLLDIGTQAPRFRYPGSKTVGTQAPRCRYPGSWITELQVPRLLAVGTQAPGLRSYGHLCRYPGSSLQVPRLTGPQLGFNIRKHIKTNEITRISRRKQTVGTQAPRCRYPGSSLQVPRLLAVGTQAPRCRYPGSDLMLTVGTQAPRCRYPGLIQQLNLVPKHQDPWLDLGFHLGFHLGSHLGSRVVRSRIMSLGTYFLQSKVPFVCIFVTLAALL